MWRGVAGIHFPTFRRNMVTSASRVFFGLSTLKIKASRFFETSATLWYDVISRSCYLSSCSCCNLLQVNIYGRNAASRAPSMAHAWNWEYFGLAVTYFPVEVPPYVKHALGQFRNHKFQRMQFLALLQIVLILKSTLVSWRTCWGVGRDSSVGIATRCGLNGSGIESRWMCGLRRGLVAARLLELQARILIGPCMFVLCVVQ